MDPATFKLMKFMKFMLFIITFILSNVFHIKAEVSRWECTWLLLNVNWTFKSMETSVKSKNYKLFFMQVLKMTVNYFVL